MSLLRDILRPEAERRALALLAATGSAAVGPNHILDLLCDGLDANTRALAVALGLWDDCKWGSSSAPWLVPAWEGGLGWWWLCLPSLSRHRLPCSDVGISPLEAAGRCWAHMESQR